MQYGSLTEISCIVSCNFGSGSVFGFYLWHCWNNITKGANMVALLDQMEIFEPRLIALRDKLDSAIVRYDAWFLVLLAVIAGLAAAYFVGMSIYCLVFKGRSFTGSWVWKIIGFQFSVECI